MRFLDCRNGRKDPSKSVLDVGVENAITFSGFDEKMFFKRGGKYVWSKADLRLDWWPVPMAAVHHGATSLQEKYIFHTTCPLVLLSRAGELKIPTPSTHYSNKVPQSTPKAIILHLWVPLETWHVPLQGTGTTGREPRIWKAASPAS